MNEAQFQRWVVKASWCVAGDRPLSFSSAAHVRLREMWEDGYSEDSAVNQLRVEELLEGDPE